MPLNGIAPPTPFLSPPLILADGFDEAVSFTVVIVGDNVGVHTAPTRPAPHQANAPVQRQASATAPRAPGSRAKMKSEGDTGGGNGANIAQSERKGSQQANPSRTGRDFCSAGENAVRDRRGIKPEGQRDNDICGLSESRG